MARLLAPAELRGSASPWRGAAVAGSSLLGVALKQPARGCFKKHPRTSEYMKFERAGLF